MSKSSINFKPCRTNLSEAHNERKVKLDYILPGREGRTDHWKSESIPERMAKVSELYESKVGQKLQKTAVPIREAVVNIKQETQIHELRALGEKLKERYGIDCFQIHIHRDEGHIASHEEAAVAKANGDVTTVAGGEKINYHAHMIFAWQNQQNGRALKLNKQDMRDIQTLTAEVLGMERGQSNSKAVRLEAKEFKEFKETMNVKKAEIINEIGALEEKKKSLNSEVNSLSIECSTSEKLIEKKLAFTKQLEQLPLREWPKGIEKKQGKDGSIYFKLGEQVARLKDMSQERQIEVKQAVERQQQQERPRGMRL